MALEESNQAKKIYILNISTLKLNATHRNLDQVVIEFITVTKEIVKAKKKIFIRREILFVNKMPLFATISCNINIHCHQVHQQQDYEVACYFNGDIL